jgi:ATP-dependent DNA ligase
MYSGSTPPSPYSDSALARRRSARRHGEDVILCAFDLLELDGWDMRPAPIEER